MKKNIHELLADYVNSHDETTISQAVGAVGKHVSAVRAMMRSRLRTSIKGEHRRFMVPPDVDHGKRCLIAELLSVLYREGKIRRVGKGVYGPKEPCIFEPQKTG